jgi:P pilus assembly chaperone PapD
VVSEHPAARSVEVAGVRIVMGPNKKPQLQYIVINHSSNELTGLNIRIAVRSVDGLADAPLFSVSSPVAALGPNQSKEIRTDLNSSVPVSAIPDWQSLRTEVLVGRQ